MRRISVPTRRRTSRTLATGCLTALLAVAGVGAANASPSGSGGAPSVSRQVSFAGTAFATAANENVDVTGRLHVVTRLTGSEARGWTLDWNANVDHATGTGATTGDRYILRGAATGTVMYPPGPLVRAASLEPSFTLMPPGPPVHPPSPIRLLVDVSFVAAGGQLIAVQVHLGDAHPIGTTD